jgi:hypothetical protein
VSNNLPPDAGDGGGLDLGVFAAIGASLGRVASMMEDRELKRKRLFESMHQVPIGPQIITITAGAGNLDQVEAFGPKAGFMWSIRRLTVSGYSAGAVIGYKNGTVTGGALVGGEPVAPFAAAGVLTFGRGDLLLDQNDILIFSATGITLNASAPGIQVNGAADNFERWLLPEYLN